MPKGKPNKGKKRNISTTKCKICDNEYKLNGFDSHLRYTHKMTTKEYREQYGEYRPKYLEYKKRAKKTDIVCKVCNKNQASERKLSHHVRIEHDLSKREYVKQYIFEGNLPICACGCGDEVTLLNQPPYHREYISGHNVHMHIGKTRSKESRMRMRKAAIKRMEEDNGTFHKSGPSKIEQSICDFISNHYNGTIIQSDTEVLSGKELDIYLPDEQIAIEVNGSRFHSDLFKDKRYHLKKTKECNDQDIHLIHIWSPDWHQRRDILESMLLSQLGVPTKRIYARKCDIKEITFKQSKEFLEKNHLQGNSVSSIRFGMFYKDELVQVMTFGKLRRAVGYKSKEGMYELLRFCSKKGYSVIGGASRLFTHFKRRYTPKSVLSFANRDWATGTVYEKMGFEFDDYTLPGYFYVKGKRRYHRYQFQKHKLVEDGADPKKTEYDIMTDRGFYKIWDVGNMKYIWKKSSS